MYDVFLDGNPTHGPLLFSPPSLCGGKKKVKTTTNKPRGFVVSGVVVISMRLLVDSASTAAVPLPSPPHS